MLRIRILFFLFILLNSVQLQAQNCNWQLSGKVVDKHDKSPLGFATVYIDEFKIGVTTDSLGNFKLTNICTGTYFVILEHLGCKADTVQLNINKNIQTIFYLEHHTEILDEIVLTAKREQIYPTQTAAFLDKNKLQQLEGKNLSEILSTISGITQLKTGANISKPIIHGMFGSRISIYNDGIKLETQDWGTEHAPEIDPFNASNIKVIKGAGSVAYGTNAMGGMIVITPPALKKYKNINANFSIVTQTNGRGITTSARIEQGFRKKIAYNLQGTYKRIGDLKAPHYNLSNTGLQEVNLYTAIGFVKNKWNMDMSYSLFHQELGILRSAHIGNLTDLKNAIASDTPLIVKPFTFKVNNPKQKIAHHNAKVDLKKYFKKEQKIEVIYAFQLNNRKEFDIRRGGRSNKPALEMHLFSNNLNSSYSRKINFKKSIIEGKSGIAFTTLHNANNAETGIRPLIPDYYQYAVGFYEMETISTPKIDIELGIRYDYTRFKAFKFDKNNQLQKSIYNFNTYAFVAGIDWDSKKEWLKFQSNIVFNSRFPNANELFSEGLHHGIATIEFGNQKLKQEHGIKWVNTLSTQYKKLIKLELNFYVTKIKNYIYSAPLPDPILTIRGAFPAFKYEQTNARLLGLDFNLSSELTSFLMFTFQASLIRGKNTINKDNLIYMPADRIHSSIEIHHDFKKFKRVFLGLSLVHIFKQNKIPTQIIDYKLAPVAYTTFNINGGWKYEINPKHQIAFSIAAENISNVSYRDYLNRFRYYADEMAWNLTIRLKYEFN